MYCHRMFPHTVPAVVVVVVVTVVATETTVDVRDRSRKPLRGVYWTEATKSRDDDDDGGSFDRDGAMHQSAYWSMGVSFAMECGCCTRTRNVRW